MAYTTVTPYDIIQNALEDIGAFGEGQQLPASDVNRAYLRLQWMLAQWQRKRWLIWHLVDLSVVSTGAQSYTIGPSPSDIVTVTRPDKLESAFLRQITQSQPNQIDYPLELLPSWEDYSRIALKSLTSFPSYIFLDSSYPQGKLYPWPLPQAAIYEVHVQVKEILNQFTGLTESLTLPEEYYPAMEYSLALRMAPTYGMPVSQDVRALARDAMNVLRVSNAQIARLVMPPDVVRPGIYNPYSDQIR